MPKLSAAEEKELDDLAFRVVADLPMGQAECDRYIALKEKRDGPEPRCSQDRVGPGLTAFAITVAAVAIYAAFFA